MSFVTKTTLRYLLKDTKNFDEIRDVCSKHSSMCRSEKQLICKKTLQVSGYTVPHDTNSCIIFDELLKLAQGIDRPFNVNRIYVDQALINSVDIYGSKALKEFFIKNGHFITIRRSGIVNTYRISGNTRMSDTKIM